MSTRQYSVPWTGSLRRAAAPSYLLLQLDLQGKKQRNFFNRVCPELQTWPNRWSSRVASASFPSVTRSSYLAPSFEFDALRPAGSLSLSLFLSLVIQNSNMYLISLRIQFSMLKFLFCLESLEAMIVVFVWLLRKFGKGWIIGLLTFRAFLFVDWELGETETPVALS